jgi:HK97 family phage prohead protease
MMAMNKDKEQLLDRYFEFKEMRALNPTDDNPEYVVEGLAVPYDVETNIGGWFKEIIRRGALDGADLKDVPLFIHHEARKIPLARSRNNNSKSALQLTIDNRGLLFRAKLDVENNVEAKALYSAVQREDISGMSFTFSVKEEKWANLDTNLPTREIIKFQKIYEISALWSPQYTETDITARGKVPDGADKRALDNARARELESSNAVEVQRLKNKILGGI